MNRLIPVILAVLLLIGCSPAASNTAKFKDFEVTIDKVEPYKSNEGLKIYYIFKNLADKEVFPTNEVMIDAYQNGVSLKELLEYGNDEVFLKTALKNGKVEGLYALFEKKEGQITLKIYPAYDKSKAVTLTVSP